MGRISFMDSDMRVSSTVKRASLMLRESCQTALKESHVSSLSGPPLAPSTVNSSDTPRAHLVVREARQDQYNMGKMGNWRERHFFSNPDPPATDNRQFDRWPGSIPGSPG